VWRLGVGDLLARSVCRRLGQVALALVVALVVMPSAMAVGAARPAIELATVQVATGQRAVLSASVPVPSVCSLGVGRARIKTRSHVASRLPIVEWRWTVGRGAKAGPWRTRVTCAKSIASLKRGRGEETGLKIRVRPGRRARRGSRSLIAPRSLRVEARRYVNAGVPRVAQGEATEGLGGAGNRFSPCECVWLAYERRSDIYHAAVAAGVPAGGVATSGDDYWWNAWRWAENARRAGIPVGTVPAAGSIIVFPKSREYGSYGHVGYVTGVNRDGSFNTEERGIPDTWPFRGGCQPGRSRTKQFIRRSIPGTQFIYGGIAGIDPDLGGGDATALQMLLDGAGQVWAKNSIGDGGWTRETGPGHTAIAAGGGGLQMLLDGAGQVWAKNSIGDGGWTRETGPGHETIAAGL
jgi:surface antigen